MLKDIVKRVPGARGLARALGFIPKRGGGRRFLLKRLPPGSVGAEIGVDKGDFSQQILEIVAPRELYLIDPWQHESSATYQDARYGGGAGDGQSEMDRRFEGVRARFDAQIRSGVVKLMRGFSNEVMTHLPDGCLDWVYVDGNHLYEYVKEDLELSFRKIKPGGYLTGDDYGVVGWWKDGVKKAVDEFACRPGAELVEIRNGQFIIRKSGQLEHAAS